ncbi:MAG: hypothetical protein KDB65_07620 [Calditrichaeota bacterium]|nr:hypothetical protein [Calditrichota bacterium]MCB9369337.1 hypothetical protein [Calditrichota bacterium]
MDLARIATIFDQLQSEGIIGNWAIAGGSAALFYVEPFVTFDVDLFVAIEQRGPLVNLDLFHKRLRELGHDVKGEHVDIDGIAVQVIVPPPGVEADALSHAVNKQSAGKEVRVVSAEYLMAICLKVGRAKDKLRLEMFLEEESYDREVFEKILAEQGLMDKWRTYLTNRG